MAQTYPRLIIAGTSSGVGKTTLTTAFIAHLRARGLQVQPFKVGPDYIDPSHLALASGRPCYNLDTWLMPSERVLSVFSTAAASADIAVIEGVMGLYDGQQSSSDVGSTAEMARLLQAPVILVIDAGAMARSAAAVVLGFQQLDPALHIAGVIANRVGGAGHARLLQDAIEPATGIPLLGYFQSAPSPLVPERHLGLVPAAERSLDHEQLALLGEQFCQTCNCDRLLELARSAPVFDQQVAEASLLINTEHASTSSVRIALAQDEAFNFYYPDTLDSLHAAGAELIPFSPLHDQALPEQVAGIYIGGGFPEEYAPHLARNKEMRVALAEIIALDIPCYAECGGLMYLCQSIRIPSGEVLPMVGSISGHSIMRDGPGSLVIGYREATALRDTLLIQQGETVRGHEFHCSSLDIPPTREDAAYTFSANDLLEGFARGNLLASYVHLSMGGFPQAAERFVDAARRWQQSSRDDRASLKLRG